MNCHLDLTSTRFLGAYSAYKTNEMKALKCKMLSAELAMHREGDFTSDDHYLLLTLLGKGHQTSLPCGNVNELQMANLAVRK